MAVHRRVGARIASDREIVGEHLRLARTDEDGVARGEAGFAVAVVRQLNVEIANQGLRVTILTGDNLSMDIIKAMSLGAYEYWVKPLNVKLFEDGLRRALTGRRPDPARRLPQR